MVIVNANRKLLGVVRECNTNFSHPFAVTFCSYLLSQHNQGRVFVDF